MAKKRKGPAGQAVPVEYVIPEDLEAHFSDSFQVTHSENEFTISFFQVQYPFISTEDPEAIKKIKKIPSRCVVRVVVTPNQIRKVSKALQDNLDKYEARFTKKKGK